MQVAPPAERSKPTESKKPASSKVLGPQYTEDVPEAGMSALQLGPSFPAGIEDDVDQSAQDTFADSVNSGKDTSEPVLQDLFAGLEKRAAQSLDSESTARSSGTLRVPGALHNCFNVAAPDH